MCHKPVFHYETSTANQQGVEEMQPLPDLLRTPYLQGTAAVGTLILKLVHREISHHANPPPAQLLGASCNDTLLVAKDFVFPGHFCS